MNKIFKISLFYVLRINVEKEKEQNALKSENIACLNVIFKA